MLSPEERRFVEASRIARLATADGSGAPHVVPVCFALSGDTLHGDTLYIAIDAKPKRGPAARLKRLGNIARNPRAAVIIDRYDEDWSRLGWVLLRGRAEILAAGEEHDRAQALQRARYPQLASMEIAALPVIALRIDRVTSWGDISGTAGGGPA